MYDSFPVASKVTANTTGNGIELYAQPSNHDVPAKIQDFLTGMGWNTGTYDPDTNEQLFQKMSDVDISNYYFRWPEAMAYEWYRMMSLGG